MSLIPSGETAAPETAENTTTETTGAEQTTTTDTTTTEKSTEGKFLFADGVVGEGEAPEWFKANKYRL